MQIFPKNLGPLLLNTTSKLLQSEGVQLLSATSSIHSSSWVCRSCCVWATDSIFISSLFSTTKQMTVFPPYPAPPFTLSPPVSLGLRKTKQSLLVQQKIDFKLESRSSSHAACRLGKNKNRKIRYRRRNHAPLIRSLCLDTPPSLPSSLHQFLPSQPHRRYYVRPLPTSVTTFAARLHVAVVSHVVCSTRLLHGSRAGQDAANSLGGRITAWKTTTWQKTKCWTPRGQTSD